MEESELPKGWKWIRLGDLVDNPKKDLVDGPFGSDLRSDEYIESGIPVFKIQNIKVNRFVDKKISFISEEKAKSLIRHSFQPGDLIITKLGEPLGLCCKVPQKYPFGIIVADLMRLRPSKSKIFDEYLIHVINSDVVKKQFKSITKGTTRARVNLTIVRDILIPVPPVAEQHFIVTKIEELLSDLDNGKQQLLTAQQELKVYRQSILKWAFEGKLTNKNVQESKLPNEWKWVNIDTLLADKKKGMATGPFGTMLKKSEHQKSGVPVLGIENIGEGVFQMPNKIFVTNEKAIELKNFRVKENDIIISRSGTIGEICLLPKRMENSIISTNLIRVSLNQTVINPKYFVYLFQGGKVRQQVFELCKGSSRAFLNQTILNSLDFPFCPLEEQQRVIDELESKLTVCDKIEETISQSLLQAEILRQSILKKAFEGKLVSRNYDSDDERDKHEMGIAAEEPIPYKKNL